MQGLSIFDDFSRCFLKICILFKYLFKIILINIFFAERDKGFYISKQLKVASFVDKNRCYSVAFSITGNSYCYNFVKRCVFCNM